MEPIGVITIMAGIFALSRGPKLLIPTAFFSSLLGASAALILAGLGGANVQPAYIILLFILAHILLDQRYKTALYRAIYFPRSGFWLIIVVIYGAMTTFFVPRLLEGATNVFAIARSDAGSAIVLVPLATSSGNLSQLMYFASDLLCFSLFYSLATNEDNHATILKAVYFTAVANFLFGLLDVATYVTSSTELLAFIRNANYTMLTEVELAGFKRMVGSFTEASAFATATLCLFAFTFRSWLNEFKPGINGTISCMSFIAIICSTSTTGYAGFVVYILLEYGLAIYRAMNGRASRNMVRFIFVGPIVLAVVICATAINPTLSTTVQGVIDIIFVEKSQSDSGIERGAWNTQAYKNFIETYGFGAGIGSNRASSFLIAVPASIGVIGTIFYFIFLYSVVNARNGSKQLGREIQHAAKGACFAQLIAAAISFPFIDLGLQFFMFAGVIVGIAGSRKYEEERGP